MPDRYWVGGTATWDGAPGTKWAATSGGTGGVSIPGPNDDVFFDANSTGTVTIGAVNNGAKSINCTGFTGTITGTGGLTVGGSITLSAGMTYTHTGFITINGTGTLTTAGKAFSGLTINGVGITVTLGDALNTVTRVLSVLRGTFTTANFSVTCGSFSSSGTNARTINYGSSTISATNFLAADSTNLTLNAGTSQLNLTAAFSILTVGTTAGSGATFYNVSFTAAGVGTRSILGSHTFNDLTINNTDTTGLKTFFIGANQTVNGTLTCSGASFSQRVLVRSNVPGNIRTLTAAVIAADDCDFASIMLVGGAAGATPIRAGDCGGNSGINFAAPRTVYRVGANTTWAGSNSWALSSGGTGANANFPLAQDTVVIDNNVTAGSLVFSSFCVGTLDASARTSGLTLNHAAIINVCGSYTLSTGIGITGTQTVNFIAPVTSTFTSAGRLNLTFSITVDNTSCTLSLADALSMIGNFTLTAGTFTTNNFNATVANISTVNTNSRTLNLGSSTVTITGNSFSATTSTNLTLNAGTSQVNFGGNFGSLDWGTGSATFYNFSFTNTSTGSIGTGFAFVNITGNFTFNNLTFSAPFSTGVRRYAFSANQTINGTLTCAGGSVFRRVFLTSDVGTVRTLTAAAISADDCDFRDITIAGVAAGASPTRAGDCGNNSGITFPAPKTVYRVGTANGWVGFNSWALSSGGTGADANFPLAQDTAVIDNNTTLATTLNTDTACNVGTLDASARTDALTLNHNNNLVISRSYLLGSGITITGVSSLEFGARSGFAEITTAGKTMTCPITVVTFGATFRPLDALTGSSEGRLFAGTFDLNGFNATFATFSGVAGNTRTLALGSSTLTLTGTVFQVAAVNLSVTGTGTISMTSASAKSFSGGGATYNCTLNNGGAGALTILGSNTFDTLSNTVQPTTFTFRSGDTTTLTNWNINGTAGNLVTINSVNNGTNTTPPILSKSSGTVSADYLAITFSNATGGAGWYAGANSVDNGVNTGWIFTAVPIASATGNFFSFFL